MTLHGLTSREHIEGLEDVLDAVEAVLGQIDSMEIGAAVAALALCAIVSGRVRNVLADARARHEAPPPRHAAGPAPPAQYPALAA